jgi:hypothetical protein
VLKVSVIPPRRRGSGKALPRNGLWCRPLYGRSTGKDSVVLGTCKKWGRGAGFLTKCVCCVHFERDKIFNKEKMPFVFYYQADQSKRCELQAKEPSWSRNKTVIVGISLFQFNERLGSVVGSVVLFAGCHFMNMSTWRSGLP